MRRDAKLDANKSLSVVLIGQFPDGVFRELRKQTRNLNINNEVCKSMGSLTAKTSYLCETERGLDVVSLREKEA